MSEVKERPAYQQRVIAERDELLERRVKLRDFMQTPAFNALPMYERHLLSLQWGYQGDLLGVLNQRVQHFDKDQL